MLCTDLMRDFIHGANSFKKLVVFWSYYLMERGLWHSEEIQISLLSKFVILSILFTISLMKKLLIMNYIFYNCFYASI